MLTILHDLINNITPIEGVCDNNDGTYRIDYIHQPDQKTLDQINSILVSWPLEKAKLEKLQLLDSKWKTTLFNGWVTPYGWKLGLDVQDVALLNGAFSLAKEASNMGINSPVSIIDTDGISHEFNLSDLTMLMLQYGQARSLLSSEYAHKMTAIKGAESFEQLNNILV